ncbi:hypothetical protein K439DRAFT_924122 [Ramaria rubella]|nr:hypothetical protein K439DRAFT_924122 [Ramaria rubella]
MSRHFCCCLPVRICVFLTSLLAFLSSALVAAVAFYALAKNKDPNNATQLTSQQEIGLGVIGGIYALIALISLFGFIGSVIRKRSFVSAYSVMTYIIFFVDRGPECQVEVNGKTEDCKDISGAAKAVVITFLVIGLCIQGYIIAVIKRYVLQLNEEQSYGRATGYVDSAFKMGPTNTAYYSHVPLEQSEQGLLAPQGHYAYSDPHHSFGS